MMAGAVQKALNEGSGSLVSRAAAGDRRAFAALVEENYDFIYRLAYRWCGRKADAEDIAQEVCARLGQSIRSFRGGSSFSSWLYAVTQNAARDWGRRASRDKAGIAAFTAESALDAGSEPDDPSDSLWAAVCRLPDKQREAVTLIYGEEMSHGAAAELMGCAEATVSWHVHEAKKRLKQILREAGEA